MSDKKKKVKITEEMLDETKQTDAVDEAEVENTEAAAECDVQTEATAVEGEPKDKKDELIAELKDKNLRQMAEFDNFRKRTEVEKSQMFDMGVKSVVEKILPVVDNFERGLATLSDEQKAEPFAAGIDKVYQQLMTELAGIGIEPIEAVGLEFDPNQHNAVMQVQSDEYESGIVAQEMQKGYKYRDTVVRYSMVAVVE